MVLTHAPRLNQHWPGSPEVAAPFPLLQGCRSHWITVITCRTRSIGNEERIMILTRMRGSTLLASRRSPPGIGRKACVPQAFTFP